MFLHREDHSQAIKEMKETNEQKVKEMSDKNESTVATMRDDNEIVVQALADAVSATDADQGLSRDTDAATLTSTQPQSERERGTPLEGMKVALLATDMVEQKELTSPWLALEGAGATVDLISIQEGQIQAFNHYDKGDAFPVERTIDSVGVDEYDALVIPGGVGNPDTLRTDEDVIDFVRDFFDQGKPVAAICHGPWVLVEAGVLEGRTLTSYHSIQTDIRNAGGNWADQDVVEDDGLITSRDPNDLPAFNKKIIEAFAASQRARERELVGTS